jgi:hypothetical protein
LRLIRGTVGVAFTLVTIVATAAPAFAVSPGNDTYGGRTVVTSGSFTQSLDTSEATTDPDDAELAGLCGVSTTEASVWYEVTAPADGWSTVDVSQSSYPAAAIVATGGPGNWSAVACDQIIGTWFARAGETYTILVYDYQSDGVNGGTLNIAIEVSLAAPTLEAAVDPVGTFDAPTGRATVSGTVRCTGAEATFLDASLQQAVGRVSTVVGTGYTRVSCDGATHQWSVEIFPQNGKFAGGKATVFVSAEACRFECVYYSEEKAITLHG